MKLDVAMMVTTMMQTLRHRLSTAGCGPTCRLATRRARLHCVVLACGGHHLGVGRRERRTARRLKGGIWAIVSRRDGAVDWPAVHIGTLWQ